MRVRCLPIRSAKYFLMDKVKCWQKKKVFIKCYWELKLDSHSKLRIQRFSKIEKACNCGPVTLQLFVQILEKFSLCKKEDLRIFIAELSTILKCLKQCICGGHEGSSVACRVRGCLPAKTRLPTGSSQPETGHKEATAAMWGSAGSEKGERTLYPAAAARIS